MSTATFGGSGLGPQAETTMRHYQSQLQRRRLYTVLSIVIFAVLIVLVGLYTAWHGWTGLQAMSPRTAAMLVSPSPG